MERRGLDCGSFRFLDPRSRLRLPHLPLSDEDELDDELEPELLELELLLSREEERERLLRSCFSPLLRLFPPRSSARSPDERALLRARSLERRWRLSEPLRLLLLPLERRRR